METPSIGYDLRQRLLVAPYNTVRINRVVMIKLFGLKNQFLKISVSFAVQYKSV